MNLIEDDVVIGILKAKLNFQQNRLALIVTILLWMLKMNGAEYFWLN